MAKGRLFEYIILYHPKEKKDKDGNEIKQKSKLIMELNRLISESDREVGMVAARQIPEEYLDKLEDVEIVVRPF